MQHTPLKLVSLIATLFSLHATQVWAQTDVAATRGEQETRRTGMVQPLGNAATLEQVVEESIMSHPEIRARYHDFRSAMEGQRVVRGNYLPQLSAQGWVGREYRTNQPEGSTTPTHWNRPGWTLELRQMIFDGLITANSVKQAGFEKLSRYYDLMATIDRTAQETVRAYLDVQRYRQMELLARENYALHDKTLAQIRSRAESGVGRRVDLEQATGRVALAQSNWMTEAANLLDVQQRFRRLTGQMPPETLAPVAQVVDKLPDSPQDFIPSLRANPEFLAKQALIQAARAGVNVAKGSFSPTLELRAATGRDRSTYEQSRRLESSNVQLLASYNLYRGGSDSARLRQTSEQVYVARDVRDYTCRNIQQELSIAWNNIARLKEQIPYLRDHLIATQKVRDGYQQQFQIGQRSLMDLLDTESELFEAKRALTNAEFETLESQYRWLTLSNRLLTTLGLAQPNQEMPREADGLETDDELLALCDASVSDTSSLAPINVRYARDGQPPMLLPASGAGSNGQNVSAGWR